MGELTVQEKRETGVVGSAIYGYYLSAAGWGLSIFTMFIFAIAAFSGVVINWWVGAWSQNSLKLQNG
jgi:uncharacterized membrane protein